MPPISSHLSKPEGGLGGGVAGCAGQLFAAANPYSQREPVVQFPGNLSWLLNPSVIIKN